MIVVVLGGTRSGKSELAEQFAADLPQPVTYLATATVDPSDPDFQARIAKHQDRRPEGWSTIEANIDLPKVLREVSGTVLVDSTGTWLSGHHDFVADVDALCGAALERTGDTVFVAEEVGLAVHPPTELGRMFVDALGTCNRRLADIADRAVLVVAGRSIEL